MIRVEWPHVRFVRLFLLMFSIVCLINMNFTILRSMRNTFAVVDLGRSAALIPYFELIGTVPGAVLVTFILARLMNRLPIQRVFWVVMGGFLLFFTLFALLLYPWISTIQMTLESMKSLPGHLVWAEAVAPFAAMLFYSTAELWKVALLSVLFWGLVNQYLSVDEAKRFYAPTILGGSIGSMLAGPLISLCTSDALLSLGHGTHTSWEQSLNWLTGLVVAVGIVTAGLYHLLWKNLTVQAPVPKEEKSLLSLRESMSVCRRSPYLLALIWIVCADYVAYGLGEVIFLDLLKEQVPDPKDYCRYMGMLGTWTGFLTALFALCVTPWLIQRYRWMVAALITPLCIFLGVGSFFSMVCLRSLWGDVSAAWLSSALFLGAIQVCLCRAVKYTLFDTAKEIAFIYLPDAERMPGKLIVDGIASRAGRGGASLCSLSLIYLAGGVAASAVGAGAVALTIALSSLGMSWRLGRMVDRRAQESRFPS